jgi:predicted phosphodiesterase
VPLALVSDLHGNDVALAAVVAELERLRVSEVVCVGDVAQGGAQPRQVLERLAALGWPVVLGNADAFLLEVPDDSPEPVTEELLAVRDWSLGQLGSAQLEQIRSFPPTVSAGALLAFHGSPGSYDDVVLPETDDAEAERLLGRTDADVLAGGHTHLQWTRRVGAALYVNPGSVGNPYDRFQDGAPIRSTAVAEYALVTRGGVEFRRVGWDLEAYLEAAAAAAHPGTATMRDRWRATL